MRSSILTLIATVAVLAGAVPGPALAGPDDPKPLPAALRELTDAWGLRSALEQQGIRFTFTYYGDAFANPIGGVKQGSGYDGRFGTIVDADLGRLIGWQGATFHASIHDIFGTQYSATNLANLMTVSGIEAPPSFRLFNLWIEQKIGSELNLRVGQFSAAQEFAVSQTASLFVNSTFGWPMAYAQDLPSGGPAYPEATPGARLSWTPTGRITLRAAVFNGDPAGPGPGNPVQRDPSGLAFRVNDPPFFIAETAFTWGAQASDAQTGGNPNQEGTDAGGRRTPHRAGSELPGSLKLGAWLHTGRFADPLFNAGGGLPATTGGALLQHHGNFAAYAILDQGLWSMPSDADRMLSGFFRASASPSDRNLVDLYLDGGLTFKGPLPSRRDDVVGLGIAWGRISPRAQQLDREMIAVTGQVAPIRDYELGLELTYQWKLADDWTLQPDLQYILHPGGHVAVPAGANVGPANAAIPDALVIGLRSFFKF
jgi:porin